MEQIIKEIRKFITGTKYENKTYIAGGFVRDKLMGNESHDIDIVVELENGGIDLSVDMHKNNLCSEPVIFKRFGTSSIIMDNHQIEFVETRREFYNPDSRNPEIKFGTVEDDMSRRDFTINSMLMNISTGEILGYERGLTDINNKIIRTTNNPDLIFSEDPLRMLRAIRFASRFNFDIDNATFNGIINNCNRLKIISKERIRDEFNKILMTNNFRSGINLLIETDLIKFILPELKLTLNMKQPEKYHIKDVFGHILDVIENITPTLEHRLSALLHDIGKPKTMTINDNNEIHFYCHQYESETIARKFLTEFKYSNDQITKICLAVRLHMLWLESSITEKTIRKYLLKHGKELILFCVDLAIADTKRHSNQITLSYIQSVVSDSVGLSEKIELPFNGYDVMEYFKVKPGIEVGKILEIATEIYLDDISLTKEKIFKEVKKERSKDRRVYGN